MFPVLLGGGELHIVQKETYTAPDEIAHYIKEHGITYIKLTPSLFHTIVNTASFAKDANFESLRLIVLGGEKIIPTDVLAFRKMYGHTEFINHYYRQKQRSAPSPGGLICLSRMHLRNARQSDGRLRMPARLS